MECEICGEELEQTDTVTHIIKGKIGNVYECMNENCENYGVHFHTYDAQPNKLISGYPC